MLLFTIITLINIVFSILTISYVNYIEYKCNCVYFGWDISYIKTYSLFLLFTNLVLLFTPPKFILALIKYDNNGFSCTDDCGYLILVILLMIFQLTFIISIFNYHNRVINNTSCICYNTWQLNYILTYAIFGIIIYIYFVLGLTFPHIYYKILKIRDNLKKSKDADTIFKNSTFLKIFKYNDFIKLLATNIRLLKNI